MSWSFSYIMKQNGKLASLFRCLRWQKNAVKYPDNEKKVLLSPSVSRDSVFNTCNDGVEVQSLEGFINGTCGSVAVDVKAECPSCRSVVESSPLSSLSAIPECAPVSVPPESPPQIPQCLSSRFVFVVAGDLEETDRLDQQVDAFCRSLEARRIGYVVVSSRSQQPLVALAPSVIENLPPLTTNFRSVQKFVWSCYRRASKVMMLITPGYLRYADAFTEGAEKAVTYQQKLIRKIQEGLKKEFFNREMALRIWPVLLHQTQVNRAHLPLFLSDTVFYWFPLRLGAENVMEILREDLSSRSPDVKRSI